MRRHDKPETSAGATLAARLDGIEAAQRRQGDAIAEMRGAIDHAFRWLGGIAVLSVDTFLDPNGRPCQ